MTYPWEQLPAVPEPVKTPAETITAMQRDMAYMVTHTAVMVHSKHAALQMLVNTPRGQIIPRGVCKFTDGSKLEFQDIGMPQPGAPEMTVRDLTARLWNIANELGIGIEP